MRDSVNGDLLDGTMVKFQIVGAVISKSVDDANYWLIGCAWKASATCKAR